MTSRQQAQNLLEQLPEKDLPQVIQFMNGLLGSAQINDSNGTLSPQPTPEELLKEFRALQRETIKWPIDDYEKARAIEYFEEFG